METKEFSFNGLKINGFLMLFANFVLLLACIGTKILQINWFVFK